MSHMAHHASLLTKPHIPTTSQGVAVWCYIFGTTGPLVAD